MSLSHILNSTFSCRLSFFTAHSSLDFRVQVCAVYMSLIGGCLLDLSVSNLGYEDTAPKSSLYSSHFRLDCQQTKPFCHPQR